MHQKSQKPQSGYTGGSVFSLLKCQIRIPHIFYASLRGHGPGLYLIVTHVNRWKLEHKIHIGNRLKQESIDIHHSWIGDFRLKVYQAQYYAINLQKVCHQNDIFPKKTYKCLKNSNF